MKQKIEWYKEVLELEPSSRVFFPLSKLLHRSGQNDEAARILRQGLLRHPEHVEARLFLIELLAGQGASQAFRDEVAALGALLRSYPVFFHAWGAEFASLPNMQTAALGLALFSASLEGKDISWTEVITSGLRSVLGDLSLDEVDKTLTNTPATQEKMESTPGFVSAPLGLKQPKQAVATDAVQAMDVAWPAASNSVENSQLVQKILSPAPLVIQEPRQEVSSDVLEAMDTVWPVANSHYERDTNAGMAEDVFSQAQAEGDEDDEMFSLRTRSMADVLAAQGDIAGAVDIYKELLASAPGDETPALSARLEALTAGQVAGSGTPQPDEKTNQAESTKLVDLLESLALRLEARSR